MIWQHLSAQNGFDHRSLPTTRLHFATLIIALCLLCGCGESGPELARVKGVVLLDGVPVPKAVVIFTPISGGRPSSGGTDDKGEFELFFSGDTKGVLPGEQNVTIDNSRPPGRPTPQPQTPARYRKPGNYTVSVQPGDNFLTIELVSDKKKSR